MEKENKIKDLATGGIVMGFIVCLVSFLSYTPFASFCMGALMIMFGFIVFKFTPKGKNKGDEGK